MATQFKDEPLSQLQLADRVIINKVDLLQQGPHGLSTNVQACKLHPRDAKSLENLPSSQLTEVETLVRRINPTARIAFAVNADVHPDFVVRGLTHTLCNMRATQHVPCMFYAAASPYCVRCIPTRASVEW